MRNDLLAAGRRHVAVDGQVFIQRQPPQRSAHTFAARMISNEGLAMILAEAGRRLDRWLSRERFVARLSGP
jgi:hypothetical protein